MLAKLHKKSQIQFITEKRGGGGDKEREGEGTDGKPAGTDGQSRQFGQLRSRGRKTPYSAHHSQITFPPLTLQIQNPNLI